MTPPSRPVVVHYQRKRRANSNYSLEFIFADVRKRLASTWNIQHVEAPCLSNGLWRRIWIALHAWWNQGTVTHVTGDITFAAILLNRKRTILTILDCGILQRKRGIKRWLLKKIWFEWPMRRTRWVTTISHSAADDLTEFCRFDHRKLKVIPVAISERFQFVPKEFSTDCPKLLQIGTAPNKNIPRLLAAIEGLNVELCIIGKLSPETTADLNSRGIRYRNLYNISEDEMLEEYRQADIVCFASLYEGFGMPILEAQATGRPVITSDRYSMPEVAGEGAILVDPESSDSIREGLMKLLQSSELRERLQTKGLENVRRFAPNRIAQTYADLYQQALN
jgi:glycosyltransferase involved in cell wall biosynthesis